MKFVASVTTSATDMRWIPAMWEAGGDRRNPFRHVLVSPLFAPAETLRLVRTELKERRGAEVYFDSGGFAVQQGSISYVDLYHLLLDCYRTEKWADWYVLPDHVPTSADDPETVAHKVRDTRSGSCAFLRSMPAELQPRAIAVVQGHTSAQTGACLTDYWNAGCRYLGFGSFGTSGANQKMNHATPAAMKLLGSVLGFAEQRGADVHSFGVTVPPLAYVFARLGVTSIDGAGWLKAGGFGNIFFPTVRGRLVSHRRLSRPQWTAEDVRRLKDRTGHECPFCTDFRDLRESRKHRILHNLAVYLDTLSMAETVLPQELRGLWAEEQPHYLPVLEALIEHEAMALSRGAQRPS